MQLFMGYEISLTNLVEEWRGCQNLLTPCLDGRVGLVCVWHYGSFWDYSLKM